MNEFEDLINTFAEYNGIDIKDAYEMYDNGDINKKDLLEAYLFNEGIFGYTDTIWNIFNILK